MDLPINYLAILACGVMAVVLGMLWFGPLFGKAWMRTLGKEMPGPEERKAAGAAMMKSALIAFVFAMVMAYVMAHSLAFAFAFMGEGGVSGALMGAFWNWLGFMLPVVLGAVLWEQKPWKWFFITAGYYLAQLALMAVILTAWPA